MIMHQVYVDIIVDAIIEQYQTEENFYSAYQIQAADWQAWKEGQFGLDNEVMQKLRICLRIMSGCWLKNTPPNHLISGKT